LTEDMPEIDGIPIEHEAVPQSVEELAHAVKEACAHDLSMVAVGGGTQLHLGNPPRSARLALHTGQLRGVVEYEPGNLTVSVQAGTTLQELQDLLGRERQFLPLDPPNPERATIGGLLATNASGPIRFRYGTARDLLLGIEVVHADGTRTRAGGKLVKNVTGYDLCKLYVGSLGTLGILSELTFKVQPKSEAIATAMLAYPTLRVALAAIQTFLRADLMPDALEAWNSAAFQTIVADTEHAPWVLLLRFGETDAAVRWQLDRLLELVSSEGGSILNVLGTADSEQIWRRASSARALPAGGESMWLKVSALHQSIPDMERRMVELGERLQARTLLFCHAGTCILYGRYLWDRIECECGEIARAIIELRRQCMAIGGHLVVEKVRPEVKRGLDVWGYEAPALELMRKVKSRFDPKGLLNPGRFVGGI
jgi:glycolate oxidase FAD binding subunit